LYTIRWFASEKAYPGGFKIGADRDPGEKRASHGKSSDKIVRMGGSDFDADSQAHPHVRLIQSQGGHEQRHAGVPVKHAA